VEENRASIGCGDVGVVSAYVAIANRTNTMGPGCDCAVMEGRGRTRQSVKLSANNAAEYGGKGVCNCTQSMQWVEKRDDSEIGVPPVGDAQFGFRPKRSCADAVYTLTELIRRMARGTVGTIAQQWFAWTYCTSVTIVL